MPVTELRDKNHWNHILNNHRAVVVDVYLDTCNPCNILAPKFEQLSQDFKHPDVAFVREDNRSQIHMVSGLPSILFYLDGRLYHNILGGDFREIVTALQKLFGDLDIAPRMVSRERDPMTRRATTGSIPKTFSAQGEGYKRFADLATPNVPQGASVSTYIPQANQVRSTLRRDLVRNAQSPGTQQQYNYPYDNPNPQQQYPRGEEFNYSQYM